MEGPFSVSRNTCTLSGQKGTQRPARPMRIEIKKVPAASVPYGRDVATGPSVWAVYEGDKLICLGATKPAARRRYSKLQSDAMFERTKQHYKALSERG